MNIGTPKMILAAFFSAALLTGCQTRNLIPEEVLQLPMKSNVYTAYTLWYTAPDEMTSDNIQSGTCIPFGTEVKILKLTDKQIVFSANGRRFTMKLDHSRMVVRTEDFVRKLFTTKSSVETAAGIAPIHYEKLRRGIIERGMTKQEVLIACGPPSALRTPSLENDTWIYLLDRVKSRRLVFKNGRVVAILTLD